MNPADLERVLIICAIWAGLGMLYLLTRLIRAWLAGRRLPDVEEVEVVAAAISRCYGHGPFRLLDRIYQDEFRRDARAAIAAMRKRART